MVRLVATGAAAVVLVAAGFIVAISVVGRPGVGATVSAGPTQPAAASLAPRSPAVSPAPTPGDELARSDTFWRRWIDPIRGALPFDANSLAEATEQADLIVRGSISDLYVGEEWVIDDTKFPLDYMKVRIDEVLKGEPRARTPGYVEVQMGDGGPDLDELRVLAPKHDAIWFLMYEPDWAPRDEPPMSEAAIAPFAYFVSNEYQGVLRNINGVVRMIEPDALAEGVGAEHFPLALEGTDFASLVDRVRDLAQASP